MTSPLLRRSRRLPAAPPRIKPHPSIVSVDGLPDSNIQSTTTTAMVLPTKENHLASTEDAEGPAFVLYVGEAEESWNECDALPNPHRALDDGLYALVDYEDHEREREGEEQASPAGHDEAGCNSGPPMGALILAYRPR